MGNSSSYFTNILLIGVDFIKTIYNRDGQQFEVKIWDTAG